MDTSADTFVMHTFVMCFEGLDLKYILSCPGSCSEKQPCIVKDILYVLYFATAQPVMVQFHTGFGHSKPYDTSKDFSWVM